MSNLPMLMAWGLIACAGIILIQQFYLLLHWQYAINDERYILQLECELQYYRSLDVPPPGVLIEHKEDYHETG